MARLQESEGENMDRGMQMSYRDWPVGGGRGIFPRSSFSKEGKTASGGMSVMLKTKVPQLSVKIPAPQT